MINMLFFCPPPHFQTMSNSFMSKLFNVLNFRFLELPTYDIEKLKDYCVTTISSDASLDNFLENMGLFTSVFKYVNFFSYKYFNKVCFDQFSEACQTFTVDLNVFNFNIQSNSRKSCLIESLFCQKKWTNLRNFKGLFTSNPRFNDRSDWGQSQTRSCLLWNALLSSVMVPHYKHVKMTSSVSYIKF